VNPAEKPAEKPRPIPTRTKPVSIAEKPAERPMPVAAEPGAPVAAVDASPKGDAVLIDAKIGDVNNRAVYASGFLEPMEAALRAEAVRLMKATNGDVEAVRAGW
jgi:hypothetical protein